MLGGFVFSSWGWGRAGEEFRQGHSETWICARVLAKDRLTQCGGDNNGVLLNQRAQGLVGLADTLDSMICKHVSVVVKSRVLSNAGQGSGREASDSWSHSRKCIMRWLLVRKSAIGRMAEAILRDELGHASCVEGGGVMKVYIALRRGEFSRATELRTFGCCLVPG